MPADDIAILELHDGIQGFHGSMGKERKKILCLNHRICFRQGFLYIAVVPGIETGFLCGLTVILLHLPGGADFGLAGIPGHFQGLAALKGRVGVVGVDGDTRRHSLDVNDAFDLACLTVIHRGNGGTEPRRVQDGGDDHVLRIQIQGENLRAVGLVQGVQLADLGADQVELVRAFQLGVGRSFQFGGFAGQVAEAEAFSAGGVADGAFADSNFVSIHTPAIGGGLNQHGARCGAGFAHLFVGVGHGGGAAGALKAKQVIDVFLGIRRSKLCPHLPPVSVQLFSHQSGKAGGRTLAELNVLDHDCHGIVRCHPDKCIEGKSRRIAFSRCGSPGR